MQSRASRVARGWTVGLIAMLIAAVSHDLGGGDFPGWLALLVGVVFAGVLGTLVIGRRRSLPRVATIVGISQATFHYLFVGLGSPTPAAAVHEHTLALGGPTGMVHGANLFEPSMLLSHLAAAIVTVVMIRSAESAVLRMLAERALRTITRVLASWVPAPVRNTRIAVPVERAVTVGRRVIAWLPRRGPPQPSFA